MKTNLVRTAQAYSDALKSGNCRLYVELLPVGSGHAVGCQIRVRTPTSSFTFWGRMFNLARPDRILVNPTLRAFKTVTPAAAL
jgi:hypothetical protein